MLSIYGISEQKNLFQVIYSFSKHQAYPMFMCIVFMMNLYLGYVIYSLCVYFVPRHLCWVLRYTKESLSLTCSQPTKGDRWAPTCGEGNMRHSRNHWVFQRIPERTSQRQWEEKSEGSGGPVDGIPGRRYGYCKSLETLKNTSLLLLLLSRFSRVRLCATP